MPRVLVVDDDPDLRELVRLRLELNGYTVAQAGNAGDAITRAVEATPDVAVLDIGLPGMDGLRLLGALRALEGLENLPICFLSARVTPEDVEIGESLGAAYLTKPYEPAMLVAVVENLLKHSRQGNRDAFPLTPDEADEPKRFEIDSSDIEGGLASLPWPVKP